MSQKSDLCLSIIFIIWSTISKKHQKNHTVMIYWCDHQSWNSEYIWIWYVKWTLRSSSRLNIWIIVIILLAQFFQSIILFIFHSCTHHQSRTHIRCLNRKTMMNKFCCYLKFYNTAKQKQQYLRQIHLNMTSRDTTNYQENWQQVKYLKCTTFKEKFFFYCHECCLSHLNSDNSSSILLNNEMSIVADSEENRLIDHY